MAKRITLLVPSVAASWVLIPFNLVPEGLPDIEPWRTNLAALLIDLAVNRKRTAPLIGSWGEIEVEVREKEEWEGREGDGEREEDEDDVMEEDAEGEVPLTAPKIKSPERVNTLKNSGSLLHISL